VTEERILVLGVGNVLQRDEGIGPRIVEEIERHYQLPLHVQVVDAGTMGLGMLYLLRDVDYLLVADAVRGTGHAPGTVLRISPEAFAPNQVIHSLHDMRLVDVLQAAQLIGIQPRPSVSASSWRISRPVSSVSVLPRHSNGRSPAPSQPFSCFSRNGGSWHKRASRAMISRGSSATRSASHGTRCVRGVSARGVQRITTSERRSAA